MGIIILLLVLIIISLPAREPLEGGDFAVCVIVGLLCFVFGGATVLLIGIPAVLVWGVFAAVINMVGESEARRRKLPPKPLTPREQFEKEYWAKVARDREETDKMLFRMGIVSAYLSPKEIAPRRKL